MKKLFVFIVCAFLSTQSFGASYLPITDLKGNGLAVSTHELADSIGQKVLDSGGNAINAAVAVGYALSVGASSSRQYRWRRLRANPPSKWAKHTP